MLLSKDIAVKIIDEISKVVDYNINIMDESGLILASTNPNRFNTHHEGAFQIIQNNLQELIVNYAQEYAGCQKGINLPIYLEHKIIGVIGITGEVDEVIGYGKVIKKMTEIMIEDLYKKEKHKIAEQAKLLFINEWIAGNFEENYLFFEQHAKIYQIDLSTSFTVAMVRILPSTGVGSSDLKTLAGAVAFLSDSLKQKNILTASTPNYIIIISNKHESLQLFEILNGLANKLSLQFDASFVGGIGHTYSDYRDVPKSYGEALRVLNYYNGHPSGTYLYDENLIALMIDEIPTIYKGQCIDQIFKNCSKKDILDYTSFIMSYYNFNGSINKIANHLYIHKNTVQYKINKIISSTGLDLRVYEDMVSLYLASVFFRNAL